jgi:drug/metabolite transporter (DMT)-like permease
VEQDPNEQPHLPLPPATLAQLSACHPPRPRTILALLASLGGVVLYSRHDIEFSNLGLLYMLVNMVAAVMERLLQRYMIAVEPIDVSKTVRVCMHEPLCPTLVVWGAEGSALSPSSHRA